MSEKLVIRGKVDESKHEGKRSEVRRMQEAENQLHEFYELPRNQVNHEDNLNHLDGYWYKGTYFHKGVGQRRKV